MWGDNGEEGGDAVSLREVVPMTKSNWNPPSGMQRIGRIDLRSGIASARALLDLVEKRLPLAADADVTTESLATQLAEELLRVARGLRSCAQRIAPDVEATDDDEEATTAA